VISPSDVLGGNFIGNDAGWLLRFEKSLGDEQAFEIGRDSYYAEIKASLPGGLEGGVYTFTIEGITDDHYAKIAQTYGNGSHGIVKLYLYWRDTNASAAGYFKNIAGLTDTLGATKSSDLPEGSLVAVLQIVSVSRKLGARRYEATVEAREWIFERLSSRHCRSGKTEASTADAVKSLLEDGAKLDASAYTFYPLTQRTDPPNVPVNVGTDVRQLVQGRTVLSLLHDLGGRMQEYSGAYGRGMFLIRQGRLHIGIRNIPLQELDPGLGRLTLTNGLLETEALDPIVTDPNFDFKANSEADTNPTKGPPRRQQFKLTLKGRPDLKPGDVVEFDAPPEDVAKSTRSVVDTLRDLAGPVLPSLDGVFAHSTTLYVSAVEHKLGRTSGFTTTLTGVVIKKGDAWDKHTLGKHPQDDGEGQDGDGNPESKAARALHDLVIDLIDTIGLPEVGEVREFRSSAADDSPSQTERVYVGLAPGDGQANQARRLAIARPGQRDSKDTPYLTPFAWGKCGLVLPRYPGVRVLVDCRLGQRNDPIETGALWEHGKGPSSQDGDWWLILPVDVAAGSLADDAAPPEFNGKVTQDLIDGKGDRVIEAGSFTIRVGKEQLKDAGQRPSPVEDTITIEHQAKHAKITIRSNGDIEIDSANNLSLKASGDIQMEATNVVVKVSNSMDIGAK
jgi:hypothetical protein